MTIDPSFPPKSCKIWPLIVLFSIRGAGAGKYILLLSNFPALQVKPLMEVRHLLFVLNFSGKQKRYQNWTHKSLAMRSMFSSAGFPMFQVLLHFIESPSCFVFSYSTWSTRGLMVILVHYVTAKGSETSLLNGSFIVLCASKFRRAQAWTYLKWMIEGIIWIQGN
jgi:hypothetical protein